ncbi:MAG: ammonia-forming cytochrome c nitrite reductase subunit c552 [Candidatus Krumholzibacteriota bacterium]
MKFHRLVWLLFLIPVLAFWGCEGDQGPAGPAGADGSTACLDCHNTEVQNAINIQYARSGHALGEYVGYAGTRSYCTYCHSGNGFVEFQETGGVDGNINTPVAINCAHCHKVHETFQGEDYALRTTAPVAFIADEGFGDYVVDFGGTSNLCANCHQSRRNEPNITDPGETFEITSTHYGPHHGPQANVLEGVLFAEIAGSTAYPTSSIHVSAGAVCVTCHMGEYTDGEGGHTWHTSLASCQGCHATADFDYGGVQTDTQALLDELQDLLLAQGVIEWVVEDEAYEPVVGTYSMVQAQAFFNWIGLAEDRSLGVHNPRYAEALLMNSIEALTAIQ